MNPIRESEATGKTMVKFLQKQSRICFTLTLVICVLSVWAFPLSLDFLARAALIGLFGGVLTGAYSKWEIEPPGGLLLLFMNFILVGGGFFWSKDHAFGISHRGEPGWALMTQYVGAWLTAFFGSLSAPGRSFTEPG